MITNSENIKQAEIKRYPDGSRWANCPWCGKRALKLQPSTVITDYLHKCHGSNCHKEFSVYVKGISKSCRKEFLVKVMD